MIGCRVRVLLTDYSYRYVRGASRREQVYTELGAPFLGVALVVPALTSDNFSCKTTGKALLGVGCQSRAKFRFDLARGAFVF